METRPEQSRAARIPETGEERSVRWGRAYFAVLAHLALWIAFLWWVSRAFGSAV